MSGLTEWISENAMAILVFEIALMAWAVYYYTATGSGLLEQFRALLVLGLILLPGYFLLSETPES